MKIVLEIPENKVSFFFELLKNFSFVKVKTSAHTPELSTTQKKELDKRFQEYKNNPQHCISWDTACKNIESSL